MTEAARAKQRERCRASRQEHKEEHNSYKQRTRGALRLKISLMKESQPCADCGFFFPAPIMEFDHRPGEVKRETVSKLVALQAKWERIVAEINKCDLVCANCHRYRTHISREGKLEPKRKPLAGQSLAV